MKRCPRCGGQLYGERSDAWRYDAAMCLQCSWQATEPQVEAINREINEARRRRWMVSEGLDPDCPAATAD